MHEGYVKVSLAAIKGAESQWTMKYRSCAPGQGVCLKGMSRKSTSKVSHS